MEVRGTNLTIEQSNYLTIKFLKMKTALIAGASGLTGSYLLKLLLESKTYSTVKVLVRKQLDIEHPLLQQIVYDYENPNSAEINADHVYCCLGTTMKKAGSKEAFKKVDYEYPLQIARAAQQNGAEKFALVSAMGANSKSMFFYNKVKGQLEEALKEVPYKATHIFHPSILLGPRHESRFGEELGKKLMKAFKFFIPVNMKPIHASQVAACMQDYMKGEERGIHIIPSGQMQKYSIRKAIDI